MTWSNILGRFGLFELARDWYYTMFGGIKPYSVKDYLVRNVNLIQRYHLILGIPLFRTGAYDSRMIRILRWVNSNFTYVTDQKKFNQPEKWEDAVQEDGLGFIQTMTGDCESGATLIIAMGLLSGISAEQLRLWCGTMSDGQGHACCVYRADQDMQLYAIDWCYNPDLSWITQRDIMSESGYYKTKWFEVSTLK